MISAVIPQTEQWIQVWEVTVLHGVLRNEGGQRITNTCKTAY
jgi:hypothetical protein